MADKKDVPEATERPLEGPKVGFSNNGSLVVKNRAYRRKWKNLAELEGRKSKKYYTKKRKKNRRKK